LDIPKNQDVDKTAQELLKDLRDVKVPQALSEDRLFKHNLKWGKNGIDPSTDEAHKKYLAEFCDQFYRVMLEMVEKGVQQQEKNFGAIQDDPLADEILQHLVFCDEHQRTFRGREDLLDSIEKHIDRALARKDENYEANIVASSSIDMALHAADATPERRPLVLYGVSGCGKTSVIAKAAHANASRLRKPKVDPVMIVRFLGTTPDSSTIHKVLRSVCLQLCRAYDQSITEIPTAHHELIHYFWNECLPLATPEKPILLFLDSIDQLSKDDNAYRARWLPRMLPLNVSLMISTLPKDYNILENIQTVLPLDSTDYLEIQPLEPKTCTQILEERLQDRRRKLTPEQLACATKSFETCSIPLFLDLVLKDTRKWHSFTTIPSSYPTSVPAMIHRLFERLEEEYGRMFVSHALGFITASKAGVSENELEDLLSLDDEVLQDIYQFWIPPIRRIPPSLWARIRAELAGYITEREADDTHVIYWYHRQFIQTARER